MFKLLRYFSFTSLVIIVLAAIALGLFYRKVVLSDLVAIAQEQSVAFATAVENAMWQEIGAVLVAADRHTEQESLQEPPIALADFDTAIKRHIRDLSVVKIKIYTPTGRTVYSTEAAQIGEEQRDNPGVEAAMAGGVATDLIHRDRFNAFDQVMEQRDLLQSYIPIFDRERTQVIGVFEVYSDLTPLLQRMYISQRQVVIGVVLILGLLYAALFAIVRRADLVMRGQAAQLRRSMLDLEQSRDQLEDQVRSRTDELRRNNNELLREIGHRAQAEGEMRKLSQAVEQSSAAIVITDTDGVIEYVNSAFTAMTGYREDEVMGNTPAILKSGQQDQQIYSELWQTIKEGKYWAGELCNRAKSGAHYWVAVSISPIRKSTGEISHYVALEEDITTHKQNEDHLRRAASVFENANEGIMITDTKGIILSVNPAFSSVTGYSEDEVVGRNANLLNSGKQDTAFYRNMWQTLSTEGRWEGEICNRRKNGELYHEILSINRVLDHQGEVGSYIGVFNDITRIRQSEERINYLTNYDELTGLPNRGLLHDRLKQAIAHVSRTGEVLAVLFMDLDRFKNINDTLGHPVGDLLLKGVAERLTKSVHGDDTVARHGGDEFAIVLESISDVEDAAVVAQRISDRLSEPFKVDGHELFIDTSIGISLYPADGSDSETLLKNADSAMYHAMDRGGGRYQYFTQDLNARAHRRLSMENNLRRALERNEFELYYQPQVALESGIIAGVEALIRWHHPDQGYISPADFIPLAEETGLIMPLGEWVMRTACTQINDLQAEGLESVKVAVNLSAKQFEYPGMREMVARIVEESRLDPTLLELELTESIIMRHAEETMHLLDEFHEMGINLSIDDFGTGYSSLSYLKKFPIDTLKIDQSFIKGVPNDTDDVEIVKAIIAIANSLNLKVIAEGVQTAAQLAFLRHQKCDEIQGTYFCKPLPLNDFSRLLREDARLKA